MYQLPKMFQLFSFIEKLFFYPKEMKGKKSNATVYVNKLYKKSPKFVLTFCEKCNIK